MQICYLIFLLFVISYCYSSNTNRGSHLNVWPSLTSWMEYLRPHLKIHYKNFSNPSLSTLKVWIVCQYVLPHFTWLIKRLKFELWVNMCIEVLSHFTRIKIWIVGQYVLPHFTWLIKRLKFELWVNMCIEVLSHFTRIKIWIVGQYVHPHFT